MNMQEDKSIIEVSHVSKYFGDKTALDDVTLNVKKGEFVTILGPSGCGKTTLLRLIAGFQTASEGEIRISGMEITQTPPHKRPVNTVFQKYALFPHLNVYDNIAFGLKLKKTPKQTIEKKVKAALKMVGMTDYEYRDVDSLSGGQQQRVAIARAIVNEQKEAKQKEGAQLEEQYDKAIKEGVQKNITNPVGVFLFKQTFYNNSTDENEALLQQIPANFQNDETIVRIKEMTDKQKKTAVGTQFVDFEMQTPEGKTVKLSDYVGKGKVVLVDFWASWCGPCRREMPNLVETYAKYKGKNFEIVGVSLDQDGAAWKEAIKKLDMTWPQMSDLKFWQSEGAQLYAVNSIPHTVLIDGSGKIIARGLHGEELQAKIAEAVK